MSSCKFSPHKHNHKNVSHRASIPALLSLHLNINKSLLIIICLSPRLSQMEESRAPQLPRLAPRVVSTIANEPSFTTTRFSSPTLIQVDSPVPTCLASPASPRFALAQLFPSLFPPRRWSQRPLSGQGSICTSAVQCVYHRLFSPSGSVFCAAKNVNSLIASLPGTTQ